MSGTEQEWAGGDGEMLGRGFYMILLFSALGICFSWQRLKVTYIIPVCLKLQNVPRVRPVH